MSAPPFDHDELMRRISRDLIDGYDEELEMEIEDRHPLSDGSSAVLPEAEKDYRRDYFQQLFRLQAELVKLQDWVVASRKKVLILFEGRDAAGKGGAIKRVAQKLNPRVCRTVALPAPNDRERTQWYFQRYVPHLPAAGEIVLFDRSWYNRAGVEQVMGFCTPEEYEEFFRSVPEFERMLVRSGITLLKYWFSITDEEQYLRFLGRIHDPLKQWKLVADGSRIAPPVGGLHESEGNHARAIAYSGGALVGGPCGRQETRAPQFHRSSVEAVSLCRNTETDDRAAAARAPRALLPTGSTRGYGGAGGLLAADRCRPAVDPVLASRRPGPAAARLSRTAGARHAER